MRIDRELKLVSEPPGNKETRPCSGEFTPALPLPHHNANHESCQTDDVISNHKSLKKGKLWSAIYRA